MQHDLGRFKRGTGAYGSRCRKLREVFERLGKTLIEEGYCRDSYIDALKTREKDFPTGVNMGGVGIAIPHTDKSHVYKGAVAIGILKKPVKFYQMGTTDEVVMARLVFMLAVDDPEEHLVFLQRILQVLQDSNTLKQLTECTKKQDVIRIIKEKEQSLS